MGMDYLPKVGPSVNSLRKRILTKEEIKIDDIPLLATEDETQLNPDDMEPGEDQKDLLESMNYAPDRANFSSPVAPPTTQGDNEIPKDDPTDDSLLKTEEDIPEDSLFNDEAYPLVPSEVIDYFTEAALKTSQRNALPDSEFGLPRLRAYPLNDAKHVKQAIRMFGHCKDPEDRKTLAKNIFKKVEELNVDVTIGKNNALYEYAPKSLQEASMFPIYGLDKPIGMRTKDEVIRDHLEANSTFYNNLFFGSDYAKSIKAIERFKFLDYFYPNFTTHNFFSRLHVCLGGLGLDSTVYEDILGMRKPLETDFTKQLTWCTPEKYEESAMVILTSYSSNSNWFHQRADDPEHIFYCLRLYSFMGEILNNPDFENSYFDPRFNGLILDWQQKVQYHYDLMKDEVENSPEYLKQAQYLFDLFWNYCDDPLSEACISRNIYSFIHSMASAKELVADMNEDATLTNKTDTIAYLTKELGFSDDVFLLPDSLEYPIINRESIRMAMDLIGNIDQNDIKIYVTNLNRKYKELGCTFSISIDHPYAKYADQNIIDHMTRVLIEGDTAIKDDGTSIDMKDTAEAGPWYKKLDYTGTVGRNLLDNKELGPNDKKYPSPDYERFDSFM